MMTPNRIKHMALMAGIQSPAEYDGHSHDCPWIATTDELARFAQLVAEDCARIVDDETDKAMDECMLGMDAYNAAEYSTKAIRARYSLKD